MNRVMAYANSVNCFDSCSNYGNVYVLRSHHLPLQRGLLFHLGFALITYLTVDPSLGQDSSGISAKEFMAQEIYLATIWLTIHPYNIRSFLILSSWQGHCERPSIANLPAKYGAGSMTMKFGMIDVAFTI